MNKIVQHIGYLVFVMLMTACTASPTIPSAFSQVEEPAPIYPDYRDIVVPPNIAPLNFMVQDDAAEACVVGYAPQDDDYQLVVGASRDGVIDIDSAAWRALLTAARGHDIGVDVYVQRAGQWYRFQLYHRLSPSFCNW